ncbi:MAG: oligoendopeptidase F [Dorea sp.]|nr:oligoendopeptidase F [Dorea sp.]
MAEKLLMRNEVPVELTWDLSLIYPSQEDWDKDMEEFQALVADIEESFLGKIDSAEKIVACVDELDRIYVLADHLGNYWNLAVSVDHYNHENKEHYGKYEAIASQLFARLSLIESELSEQPEERLLQALELAEHGVTYIKNLIRSKAHQLSPETEKALAAYAPVFNAPMNLYETAKLADMRFDDFEVEGKKYPLGYALFEDDYQHEEDTAVRRAAFDAFSEKIRQYEHVTAAIYNTQLQNEKITANVRGFDSVFDYLLFDQQVSREMYDRQIDLIMEKLAPHMRRYAKLLQKSHGLEKMTYADLKITLDPEFDPSVTVEESKEYVKHGLAILGEDYQAMIEEAYRNRWVDYAKNQGKSTGGFCESPYQKYSFILLSWNDKMSDVCTLAHEFGHAGHFRLCQKEHSFLDTNVSTYFVEAPSTMNELLMENYLINTSEDLRFRRWVLSIMISNTYYHNFVTHLLEAAYQREIYKIVDAGGSIHAGLCDQIFKEVLTKFWGDAVEINEGAELTWMRQPHYYIGLYPYTYSAGLTIATQVSKRIREEGQVAVEDWLNVLRAGSTLDPVGFAKAAGVDITTDQPLVETIAYIGSLIDEIENLTERMERDCE